ncbi:hypothetical protein AVEN_71216-1 [Araneus ventricosus]|uniref:Uncharacterized protein n=1 Tax=Araneus ventricosus TaxID=182803 RepID=A0A4Y2IPX8_ARAVE|nr:hypothetical protein AVEN_71216-1 [Araneus ventricosus]
MNPTISRYMTKMGENSHEAEYDFILKDCVYKDLLECTEEYNNICPEMSTAWKFCIKFQVVFTTGTVQCILNMKRMDDMPLPMKINFSMSLSDIEGALGHPFHFQETVLAGGQEKKIVFDPVISFRNLNPATYHSLKATVCFRFYGCHTCFPKRDYSLSSCSDDFNRIHFTAKLRNLIFKCFCL